MKAGFISLGCAKNLVDTEIMLGILQDHGIELTTDPADADILIVNTCAFIQSAKEESINTILDMAEYKKPDKGNCKSLIIAGCLGQRYGNELLEELPEADGIIGTEAWDRIGEVIDTTLQGNRVVVKGDAPIIYDAAVPRIPTTPRHTAYVKIAEGCNNQCAFCAIPLIRGKYRSRKLEDVLQEVKALAENGVKEIVLIAQDTTQYGRDIYGEPKLAELLERLCDIEEIKWIRTLYSYPRFFNDELIEVLAREEKLVKYVDIPLQHANDQILRSMRRPDTKAGITELLKKLRQRIPGVVIRSTFIVGFPGETDEQFEELKEFIRRFGAKKSLAKQATSRKKMLDKIQIEDLPVSNRKYPYINFKYERELGKDIVEVNKLHYEHDGKVLLDDISFRIGREDKVLVLGANENAVSALLSILGGEITDYSGSVKWGTTVLKGDLPKDTAEYFKNDFNIIEWLAQFSKEKDSTYLRGFLGRMLFSGDDGLKKVKVLSGGEKVRCMLSRLMVMGANVLILDQPTNHLDLESITALNEGMTDFKGAMLFSTHDHELAESVANRIFEIKDGKLIDRMCDYEEYLSKKVD